MRYEKRLLAGGLNLLLCVSTIAQMRSRSNTPIKPRGPAAPTIKLVKTLKLLPPTSSSPMASAVSPNGNLLVLARSTTRGADDYAVELYDAVFGRLLHRLVGHTRPSESVAFSPDSTMVISGSFEFITTNVLKGEARLWDTRTGSLLQVFKGSNAPFVVAFSPDGSRIATATSSETNHDRQSATETGSMDVMLWSVRTGRLIQTLTGRVEGNLRTPHVEFSPNGQLLAATNSETINLWNLGSGTLIHTIKNEHGSGLFRFTSSGTLLKGEGGCAFGSLGINLWDVKTGELLLTIDPSIGYPPSSTECPNGDYWFTVFSEDEQQLTAISNDSFRTWDIQTGRLKLKIKLPPRTNMLGETKRLINRKTLITIDGDGVARWWEITGL